jgi:hypothetical protein
MWPAAEPAPPRLDGMEVHRSHIAWKRLKLGCWGRGPMASKTYAVLSNAIREEFVVVADYNGYHREMCRLALGEVA